MRIIICSNQIWIQFLFTTCLTFSLLTTCRSGKCIIMLYYRYMNKSISLCVHVCQISGHASNFITSVTLYIWACGHSCHSLMIQCLSLMIQCLSPCLSLEIEQIFLWVKIVIKFLRLCTLTIWPVTVTIWTCSLLPCSSSYSMFSSFFLTWALSSGIHLSHRIFPYHKR